MLQSRPYGQSTGAQFCAADEMRSMPEIQMGLARCGTSLPKGGSMPVHSCSSQGDNLLRFPLPILSPGSVTTALPQVLAHRRAVASPNG